MADSKRCGRCKADKPLSEFAFYKSWNGRPYHYCKTCANARATEWGARNPERRKHNQRSARLRRQFGVTYEAFAAQLAAQGGKCAICKSALEGWRRRNTPVLDHDHETGANRDILCQACNLGLGHFADDAARLIEAAAYIQKHRLKRAA